MGCLPAPQIEHYRVPKQHVIDKLTGADRAGKDRILAAIVPHGEQNWFFKLSGQSDLVTEQSDAFTAFVKSVRFSESGTPEWTLPKGWMEEPGEGMRFATLQVETSDGTLEATVTTLPRGEQGDASYALMNVNRWRGQLGLAEIDQAQLDHVATHLELDGTKALLIDFEGRLKPGGMGKAPFASRQSEQPPGPTDAGQSLEPTYDVPSPWNQVAPGAMQKARFEVAAGGQEAEISISTAGGELLANVNRWRGQVQLGPIDQDQLLDSARRIDLGDTRGAYFQLVGSKRTILGVVAPVQGEFWFVKLAGDNDLAERERERFERFVRSIHFRGAEGADDGK
jgi:hypothetical protein